MVGFGTGFTPPKCGHCNGTRFASETIEAAGSNYKHVAICCANCKAVLGVTDYFNAGQGLKAANNVLTDLQRQVRDVEALLLQIQSRIP